MLVVKESIRHRPLLFRAKVENCMRLQWWNFSRSSQSGIKGGAPSKAKEVQDKKEPAFENIVAS